MVKKEKRKGTRPARQTRQGRPLREGIKYKYIAVEGPPGVGKTALAKRMARVLGGRNILEAIENPFLDDFYEKKKGAAFQNQLFFLVNRFMLQREMLQKDLFREFLISDFIFEKDRIYAYLNLDDQDLLIYEKIFKIFEEGIPQPELVIYLQASDEILGERLERREDQKEDAGRLTRGYLSELNKAYNYYFFHYGKSPLLVVNTSEVDYSSEATPLDDLFDLVRMKDEGTQYYVPLGLD